MSAASEPVRAARFYTSARRLPWVIGKFADWRIPFGPYNAAQIGVMSLGGLLLVKTSSWWWSLLGPVPVIAWAVLIFVCRRHKVAGRTPVGAVLGVLARIAQPAGGRMAGRAARDRRSEAFTGRFTLQGLTAPPTPAPAPARAPGPAPASASAPGGTATAARRRRPPRAATPPVASAVRRPLSPVQAALLTAKDS
ncbi:hypothetical protein ACTWJ8_40040 (plasmid) [Streptomyces sp. SDT5-1]|uniref:hypothetical protein n=1 Tax=Streptomyces sp. SDT5-1 TaxID=3406418 RepID=UPI003FD2D3CB